MGEAAASWQTWSDGAGGSPLIQHDSDWGKIKLELAEIGHSSVIDTANFLAKQVTITTDKYGSGIGEGKIYLRGQLFKFDQDDATPSWMEYTESIAVYWRYLQVKLVGPAG